jgi:hypothetical protein
LLSFRQHAMKMLVQVRTLVARVCLAVVVQRASV